jgi:hypothetical protein
VTARHKRQVAFGVLWGLVGVGLVGMVAGFVAVWLQRGATMALIVIGSLVLAVLLPFWIVEWAHAEDEEG